MRGPRISNPFRMYGVERSLTVTSPAPGAELSRSALDEVQVSAYHTSEQVTGVYYRLDGRGRWRSLKPSGDFTWHGEIDDDGQDRGEHEIEVMAVDDSGERWSETSTYSVQRRSPDIDAGADWAQFHGDEQHSGVAGDLLEPTCSSPGPTARAACS